MSQLIDVAFLRILAGLEAVLTALVVWHAWKWPKAPSVA